MERLKNFIPMPTEFMERAIACNLSKPELRVLHAISYEILRWHNCRRTMSKKISHSFIAEKLKMHPGNVTRTINKLEKKEFIIIVEKGTGSAPSIIKLNCSIVQSTVPADFNTDIVPGTAVEEVTIVQSTLQNNVSPVQSTVQSPPDQINISIKKDHVSENDSFNTNRKYNEKVITTIEDNGKKIVIREKNSSLNSINVSKNKQSVINLLCPGGGAASTDEFSSIGSVIGSALATSIPDGPAPVIEEKNTSSEPQVTSINITDKTLSAGKEVLKSKNYNLQEIQSITQRIFESMKKQKKINNGDRYFLKAVYNEKAKGKRAEGTLNCKASASSDIHVNIPGESTTVIQTATARQVQAPYLQIRLKKQVQKEDVKPTAEETLKRIKDIAPIELYEVTQSVDADPKVKKSLAFFSSDIVRAEILASHYVAEFKKRYPEKLSQ